VDDFGDGFLDIELRAEDPRQGTWRARPDMQNWMHLSDDGDRMTLQDRSSWKKGSLVMVEFEIKLTDEEGLGQPQQVVCFEASM
jgi:hypothetical protein